MKNLFFFYCSIFLFGCVPEGNYSQNVLENHYLNNEDKFGFIVFNKENADSFLLKYNSKAAIIAGLNGLLTSKTYFENYTEPFSKHTTLPQ